MLSMKIDLPFPYPNPTTHPINLLDNKNYSLSFLEIPT
jgi:hypothetical protein